MHVQEIRLRDFRNYSNYQIDFDPGINLIIGENGIGKSNILESIIFISNTKSYRTYKDEDMIKNDSEYSRIELDSDNGKYKIVLNKSGKTLYINDQIYKRASDYIGKLNAILFKPGDIELFNQSPKERRRLLDIEIGKVSKNYLYSMSKYIKLLKDKNKLLKEEKIDEVYLNLIDESLAPEMAMIIKERIKFFEIINKYINDIYQNISGSKEEIKLIYKPCSSEIDVLENIKKNRERDIYYRYCNYGCHHEDYSFLMNNHEITSYASQGQKRMTLISFKLALIKYIEELTNLKPILLLDDVFSELDNVNSKRLLNSLPKDIQVIITDTKNIDINQEIKVIDLKEEK